MCTLRLPLFARSWYTVLLHKQQPIAMIWASSFGARHHTEPFNSVPTGFTHAKTPKFFCAASQALLWAATQTMCYFMHFKLKRNPKHKIIVILLNHWAPFVSHGQVLCGGEWSLLISRLWVCFLQHCKHGFTLPVYLQIRKRNGSGFLLPFLLHNLQSTITPTIIN